jgi:hypothetical protein
MRGARALEPLAIEVPCSTVALVALRKVVLARIAELGSSSR